MNVHGWPLALVSVYVAVMGLVLLDVDVEKPVTSTVLGPPLTVRSAVPMVPALTATLSV